MKTSTLIGAGIIIGGGLLLFSMAPSPVGTVQGWRLVGDCEAVERVEIDVALSSIMQFLASRTDLDAANVEAVVADYWRSVFPQCQWPPSNPEMRIAEGSWRLTIETMQAQLGAAGLDFGAADSGADALGLAVATGGG